MRASEYQVKIAWLLSAVILAAAGVALWLNGVAAVASEQGAVEVLSAVTLLATAILFWVPGWKNPTARAGGILILLAMARELDLDKLPFSHGILSLKLYTGAAPLWEKLIGLLVALLIIFTVYRVVRNGTVPLLRGVIAGQAWAWLILSALLLVGVAKTLDGAGRKLATFGMEISVSSAELAQIIEETGELASALCLMLGVVRLPDRQTITQARNPNGRTYSDGSLRDDHLDRARSGK